MEKKLSVLFNHINQYSCDDCPIPKRNPFFWYGGGARVRSRSIWPGMNNNRGSMSPVAFIFLVKHNDSIVSGVGRSRSLLSKCQNNFASMPAVYFTYFNIQRMLTLITNKTFCESRQMVTVAENQKPLTFNNLRCISTNAFQLHMTNVFTEQTLGQQVKITVTFDKKSRLLLISMCFIFPVVIEFHEILHLSRNIPLLVQSQQVSRSLKNSFCSIS